jgi:hypothetical protein
LFIFPKGCIWSFKRNVSFYRLRESPVLFYRWSCWNGRFGRLFCCPGGKSYCDRYNIHPDAAIELQKILIQLQKIPEINMHIESHTDSRGEDAYNLALSDKRAAATMAWFIDKGIAKERLSAKGYGEEQLVNECSNGVKCTEKEHLLNRRSMFIRSN